MRQVAPGVRLLDGFPPDMFNVYLVEDVLLDAGTRWARPRVMRQLHGRQVSLVALTHCHPDHQGVANFVCEKYRVPLACHEADVPAMEGRAPMGPRNWIVALGERVWAGPPRQVERVLRGGDVVAGFRVVPTPGHTPGHVAYFRDADRVAIVGDALANVNFLTGEPGLRLPPPFFSVDFEQARRSVQVLADLRPSLVCFGHGPPLQHTSLLRLFAARLRERDLRTGPRAGKDSDKAH